MREDVNAPGNAGPAAAPLSVMQVLHQGGGAGSVVSTLHLSLGLARAGLHVRLVCPPGSEVEALARAGGLEVLPLQLAPHQRRRNAAALATLLARHPVALVNSQSARDREALTWLALTRRLPIPFCVTRRQMPHTFVLENWLMSRAAARVIAVSHAVGEALVRRGTPRRKLAVIPNGLVTARIDVPVSAEAVDHWRTRIGWDPSRRTIGIIGRLKQQAIVLRALEWVATPVRLVLAGVAPGTELEEVAARVPPRHAVVLLPFDADVRPLYDLLELVLLPTRSEGLSQALLEAMALGKPVIASRIAANAEVVTPEADGLLVAPDVPAEWASAIEALLGDRSRAARLGAAARRTARDRFALERTVERTIALYHEIVPR